MTHPLSPLGPRDVIDVSAAFRQVNALLIELLESFSSEDWLRPTVHASRDVKDLVAHLLHGDIRRLSTHRDRFTPPTPPIHSIQDLTDFIQADNRAWMTGMRRVSPQLLIELVRRYDEETRRFLESLDPFEEALFPVAWAGETRSLHWFDVAREYTEKWHHQQQLRDATGRPPLYAPELLVPTLETFARGLPFAYRDVTCAPGTMVTIAITGAVELSWTLRRNAEGWSLWQPFDPAAAAAEVTLDADKAWRIWTKGLTSPEADSCPSVVGDRKLAEPALRFVAIMA